MRSCLAHIQRNLQCTKLQMSRSLALRRTFFLAFFPFYFIIWSRARPGHVAERRFSFVKFVCVSAATIFFFIFLPSHSTSRFSSFALFTHCRQRAFVERVEPRDSLKIKIGKIFLWAFFFSPCPCSCHCFSFYSSAAATAVCCSVHHSHPPVSRCIVGPHFILPSLAN